MTVAQEVKKLTVCLKALCRLAALVDKVQHLKACTLKRCRDGLTVERVGVRTADDDGLCGLGELCRFFADTSDKPTLDEYIIIG